MIYFIVLVTIKLLTTHCLFAQNKPGFFVSLSGEFPAINLSKSDIVSQQNSIGLGYAFPNNFELNGNLSLGVLGAENGANSFVNQTTGCGIDAAYLHPFKSGLKAGIELGASYAFSDLTDDINYDHTIYQAGIKLQKDWAIGSLGVRYRSFFDYPTYNGTEIYIKLGMRFGLFK